MLVNLLLLMYTISKLSSMLRRTVCSGAATLAFRKVSLSKVNAESALDNVSRFVVAGPSFMSAYRIYASSFSSSFSMETDGCFCQDMTGLKTIR